MLRGVRTQRARAAAAAAAVLALLAVVTGVGPIGSAGAQRSCPGADEGGTPAAVAEALRCLIAAERANRGLAPVLPNAALDRAARDHAADMVARQYFSTVTPEGRGPEQQAAAAGYSTRAPVKEVIAYGTGRSGTPRATLDRWLAQPERREILLDPDAIDIGAGAAPGAPAPRNGESITYTVLTGRGADLQPVPGKSVVARVERGTVFVQPPAGAAGARARSARFVRLTGARILPVGTLFDTRRGTVLIASAARTGGGRQSGSFFQGRFRIYQARASRRRGRNVPLVTEARVAGRLVCATARRSATPSATRSRRLWGRARGRFRTRGRYATATVRGTEWLTEDSCAGTRVRVVSGAVSVRDVRRRVTRRVRAGRQLLIRAPRR